MWGGLLVWLVLHVGVREEGRDPWVSLGKKMWGCLAVLLILQLGVGEDGRYAWV
jgi:hypothetical protein